MKKLLTALTVMMLLVVVIGCSDDDDCATCSSGIDQIGFVTGSIYLDPECYMDEMFIFGLGAVPPNIDSLTIGDSLLYGEEYLDYDYDEDYHENYWEVSFYEDGNETTYMYNHLDTATVTFYGEGKTSSATFKILDADSAECGYIEPDYNVDTVDAPDTVVVSWEPSDGADYYAVWVEFSTGNNYDYFYQYYYATDTTFTVLPEMFPDSVRYFYVDITPFTGPDPTTGEGNVTGDLLIGKIYSFGWSDYTRIQGWFVPVPTAKVAPEPERVERTPIEKIDQIYKKYSR